MSFNKHIRNTAEIGVYTSKQQASMLLACDVSAFHTLRKYNKYNMKRKQA
jgi:hypothetical protein